MIGRIIIAEYFREPWKAEIDQDWIWIGVRLMEMALLWAWLTVGKDCGKADPTPLDARHNPRRRCLKRGRKQQIINLRDRVLSPIPVRPPVLRRAGPLRL